MLRSTPEPGISLEAMHETGTVWQFARNDFAPGGAAGASSHPLENSLPWLKNPPARPRSSIRRSWFWLCLAFSPVGARSIRFKAYRARHRHSARYQAGAPEKSPMFYFGRQSQGAEGRIYPYPLYDTLTGKKVDKTYRLVYLENEYVKIGILPEIGGRLFEAVDKTQRLRLLLSPARHQAGSDRADRGVDFRRHRVEHPAPSPGLHVPAGPVPDRGERRRQQDRLGGRAGTAAAHALGCRLYAAPGQVLPRSVDPDRQPNAGGQHHALLRQRRGTRQQ